jgi:hypothetical protein
VDRETPDKTAPDRATVQQVMEDVLSSPPFCHTQQCQNLLRYIVKHSLAQEEHLLRERVIGAEVFGRRPDYETGDDPVVRIRVAEVRKRLAQYYQSVSHSPNPPDVQIEIPSGSYRASFRWLEAPRSALQPAGPVVQTKVQEPPQLNTVEPTLEFAAFIEGVPPVSTDQTAIPAPRSWRSGLRSRWVAAVMISIAAVAVVLATVNSSQERAFRAFWHPWTSNSKPVIIAVGSNAVYRFSDEFTDDYARTHNLEAEGMEFFIPLDPNSTIKASDIHPAVNSFVALGDVSAVSAIVAAVTRQHQAYQERFPNDISFAELRDDPTVLVGGFNNPMTLELTKYLPFVLRARNEIDDTSTPGRRWMLHASDDSHDTEDYAVITRMGQSNGDAPILSVAGMGQYGTIAAAGFICNPASVAQLVRQLPRDWASHNLQVVLHVRVVDFKAVSSDVVAVKSW